MTTDNPSFPHPAGGTPPVAPPTVGAGFPPPGYAADAPTMEPQFGGQPTVGAGFPPPGYAADAPTVDPQFGGQPTGAPFGAPPLGGQPAPSAPYEQSEPPMSQTAPTIPLSPAMLAGPPIGLAPGESILATYEVARKTRPLGKLASYLFITDKRVVYSAEAKSFAGSSVHNKQYALEAVDGLEVKRNSGLDALALTIALGALGNFLLLLIVALMTSAAASATTSYFGSSTGLEGAVPVLYFVAFVSLIAGAAVVFLLSRPSGSIAVISNSNVSTLANRIDIPKLVLILLLFIFFGPALAVVMLLWLGLRALGVFRATDAQTYPGAANLDAIAFEAGAVINDARRRAV